MYGLETLKAINEERARRPVLPALQKLSDDTLTVIWELFDDRDLRKAVYCTEIELAHKGSMPHEDKCLRAAMDAEGFSSKLLGQGEVMFVLEGGNIVLLTGEDCHG